MPDENTPPDNGFVYHQSLKNWKGRTTRDLLIHTGIVIPNRIQIDYGKGIGKKTMLVMETNGDQYIYSGYCTDYASGPTVDTPDTIRAACGHDGGYQPIRKGLLPKDPYKELFDRLLERLLIEDGMKLADHEDELAKELRKKGGFMNGIDAIKHNAKATWIRNTIKVRAAAWYQAVKYGGGKACEPGWDPTFDEQRSPY